ncbi:hypothetical protein [Dissulfurispira sp.]|uniref:hypothetical protein n=1 Tax=Dissulfurispira sp. TaxID=2817609 RepID=UPI002FDA4E2B
MGGKEIGLLEVRFLKPKKENIFIERSNRFLVISLFGLGGLAVFHWSALFQGSGDEWMVGWALWRLLSYVGMVWGKKPVRTIKEAERILKDYFSKYEDIKIGKVKEREWFFEADIKDKNNNLIDKVIIDKRTGRIRSIY